MYFLDTFSFFGACPPFSACLYPLTPLLPSLGLLKQQEMILLCGPT